MKFGLCYIPDYHAEHSGSWSDWYEGMIAEVRLAEALGFDSAWFAEHRVPGFAFGSPALFIAACARETKRIRLAASVSLLPLNNPVRTAEDYAMADVLSRGRLDFGVGRGLYKYDYDVANVPMDESRERFNENLTIIRKLWPRIRSRITAAGRRLRVTRSGPSRCSVRRRRFHRRGAHDGDLSVGRGEWVQPADRAVLLSRSPRAAGFARRCIANALRAHGHDPAAQGNHGGLSHVLRGNRCRGRRIRRCGAGALSGVHQGDRSVTPGLPRSGRLQGLEGLLRKPREHHAGTNEGRRAR